jgi:hypothetical protein
MSKAAELAALIGSQSALSDRNLVINGAFQVWQRGTSSSSVGYNTADRWRLHLSGASATASQGTFANGQTAVPGNPQFYMALNVTTGNDNAGLQYRHEGTQQLNGEVYTLSFWAKSATPATMTVGSHSYDASADVDDDNTVSPSTFTPTSSWQKFTFKITHSSMPNLGAYANGDYTLMSIGQGSSTSTAAWKLDLALVQFEKGEQATPFEHRSFGDELALCQRYFQTMTKTGYMAGRGNGTTSVSDCRIPTATVLRASPTISGGNWSMTKQDGTTLYTGSGETYSVQNVSSQGVVTDIGSVTNGTDNAVMVISVTDVTLDAEL